MRPLKSDAKIDRIVGSWLRPTRVDATWLAAVADEVSLPAGSAPRSDRFCYITLDRASGTRMRATEWACPSSNVSRTMLVIDGRHRSEAARRIPALSRAWAPRPAAVDEPDDHVVLELRPVASNRRGRRHA
ncbi:hypothetical protein [Ilumatobacter nonamiensis]|uniref:hypothetical protein n=1 Tax=Ilumatobacter nonamiensis TaxID=467093 RepID=UPI00034A3A84|nr:hypothetical protein [Ilumatobacter nonamiensis]